MFLRISLLGYLLLALAEGGFGPNRYYNSVSPSWPPPTTCSKRTPCYDVSMATIWDGELELDLTPGLLEKHFRDFNIDLGQHFQESLEFMRTNYNLNFPTAGSADMTDTSSAVPSDDNTATLMPFVYKTEATRARIYTASVGERAAFLNLPLEVVGNMAVTTRARPAQGSRNLTIPANSVIYYGYFFLDQCPEGRDWRLCQDSILTPYNPRERIVIKFWSQYYTELNLPPSRYSVGDCDLYSDLWGNGTIHGIFPLREGSQNTVEGREVMTFPGQRE